MILQYVYKPVLNFIYDKITFRISDKARNYILWTCFFLIFAVQFLAQYVFLYQGLNRGVRDYIICLLLGVIILLSVNKRIEIIKWRKLVYIPYILVGILLLIAALDHEMGPAYQAFPLVMLVAFMCLYYVWGNRGDYTVLFESISKAYVVFIAFLFAACVALYPYYDNSISLFAYEYAPFGINPNGVTKIFAPGIVCGLYLAVLNGDKKRKYFFSFISGVSAGVILLTSCRTGLLIILALAVIYVIYIVIDYMAFRGSDNRNTGSIGSNAVIIALIVISCILGMCMIKYASTYINSIIPASDNNVASEEQSLEQTVDVRRGISDAEENERDIMIAERIAEGNNLIMDNSLLVKLNQIMTGRVAIWAVYFDNMTWRGSDQLMFYDTEYAHNQYIELSYKAGIPTGVIYLILNLLVGLLLLIRFFKKDKCDAGILFQFMSFAVFFLISMLDTGILPFERGFIFIYYIVILPLFFRGDKERARGKKE